MPVKPVVVPTPARVLVPPAVTAILTALETAGELRALDIARGAVGMPPRPLSDDEEFVATVRKLVTSGAPVGFNCANVDECEHKVVLVESMDAPAGKRYRAKCDVGVATRFEVSLA